MALDTHLAIWKNSPSQKLLDLRSKIRNSKCIIFSTWIPLSDLADRWCELPPKIHPFAILVSEFNSSELEQARFIREKGWSVSHIFIESSDFWAEAQKLELVAPLPNPYLPLKLLFSPSPFLSKWFDFIEESISKNKGPDTDLNTNYRSCIDVGCGSGRDLGWIGVKNRNWKLVGLDCVEKTLSRARQLLKNLGISPLQTHFLRAKFLNTGKIHILRSNSKESIDSTEALFKDNSSVLFLGREAKFDLVLCIRCLQRESFPHLRDLVRPGGFLLFSTFVDGYPEYSYDHPSPESGMRLKRDELKESFGESFGFRIISDTIEVIEDGRPVNSFLSQRL